MQFRAKIKNKGIEFSSPLSKHKLLQFEGSELIIEIDDKPTSEMRRYFEGAVIPSIFYQLPRSGWKTFKDCREAIKLEFLPSYTTSIKGERLKYPRSTAELSKAKFTALLDKIMRWMEEQGMELPDPEDYKAWRDSAPAANEVYPPLKRLIESYQKNI